MTVRELIEMLEQIPDKDKDKELVIYDDIEQGCCKDCEWYYVHDGDDYAIELHPLLI